MATVDFSNSKQRADMGSPQLNGQPSFVAFQEAGLALSDTNWNWTTPGGHRVDLDGSGFTYDVEGHAYSGTVNTIRIDLGNNDAANPDIVITGLNADAVPLDENPENFWNILSGNDTIYGGTKAKAGDSFFRIAGDGLYAPLGSNTGGNDIIYINDAYTYVYGDVFEVTEDKAGSVITYRGGNDTITGEVTSAMQAMAGDNWDVYGNVRVIGGADTLVLRSTALGSTIVGDITNMRGSFAGRAVVQGGNDTLLAGVGVTGEMVGDVANQGSYSYLRGGHDTMSGSDMGQIMVGDVHNGGETLVGGSDTIRGYGGNDDIIGDVFNSSGDVTGGNDTIYGGEGNDRIFGEYGNYGGGTVAGGNDRLYGEGGNDFMRGQSGNDRLDGGTGDDTMEGGIGNDVYVVDSYLDIVKELPGEGIDTIETTLNGLALVAGIENLKFTGTGNFEGRGNDLSNQITGGNGDDTFYMDGQGNDTIIGQGGTDSLYFRDLGAAIVNLATNANGGSAAGDRFLSIERIFGSDTGGDTLTAANTRAIFFGYGGNDTLNGGAGMDSLYGGDGNDRVSGGAGNDAFVGGEEGNDVLSGGLGNDTVDGGTGNDRMQGDQGNDYMRGGEGIDVMLGGDGNDQLYGDNGADLLIGGMGRDILEGGMNGDRFDFNAAAESGPGAARDIINDFTVNPDAGPGYVDRIDVSTIDAKAGMTGDQAFIFLGSGAFTGEGQIRAIQVGANTLLQFNVAGANGAEMEILLMNVQANTLSGSDFIL